MTLTTARTEVNNEIVSLRQYVRQARICVVNKLVREAKRLRTNRGSEKQLEKNKNKADKFLREIMALKRIKDDEISKFGIASLEHLQEILQNSCTDDKSRVMTKVVCYKSLKAKLIEFKEKFPDYKEYISRRKKKHSAQRKTKDPMDESQEENSKRLPNKINSEKAIINTEGEKIRANVTTIDRTRYKTRQEESVKMDAKYEKWPKKTSLRKEKKNSSKKQLEEDVKDSAKTLEIDDTNNDRGSKCTSNVISNEAAVKRFAELLQETNTEGVNDKCEENNKQQSFKKPVEVRKKIDDFFLNSYEVVSCSNVTTFPQEEHTNVFNSTLKALQVKNGRDKFRREKVNRERSTNAKVGKINNKVTSYDRNSIAYWKQKKIVTPAGKTSTVHRNVKIANSSKNENLHPSWMARRKQQEIMKQGFQGKKIRFDED